MQITSAVCRTARPRQIFVEEQDMPRLQSLLRRIQSNIYEVEATKKVNRFFRPQFIRGEQIGLV